MTPLQRAFYEESGPRTINLNQRIGRRYATEMWIVANAATPEDARLALDDLRTKGIAMLSSDGKRVQGGEPRRYAAIRFDEEKRRR